MTEIFVPMFYMMCLTATVFLFSTGIRLKEIYLTSSDTAVDGEEHRHPPFDNGSVVLRNSQRNLTNLFEVSSFVLHCLHFNICDEYG